MSPEMRLTPGRSVLEEAESIKREAIKLQANVELATSGVRVPLQKRARHELDYAEPDLVDVSDLVNTNISYEAPVIAPDTLVTVLPVSSESAQTTRQSRERVNDILERGGQRLVAIVGPCSIHDPEAALEYADHITKWREQFGDDLEIVMRLYVEKPRTIRGWKGLVYDPKLNETDDINLGLIATRMLACHVTHKGVPIAMERLNALTPQYLNGLVTYDAIGARNTTDQTAREYASGSSSPVGFKNTPDGNILPAVEAVASANGSHALLGIGMNGMPQRMSTKGNKSAHVILRGGQPGPNYNKSHIHTAKKMLAEKQLLQAIIVDASHGNSGKHAGRQIEVIRDISTQIVLGETAIRGVMIESNLVAGRQDLVKGRERALVYGKSITDECAGLEETEEMLSILAHAVRQGR